MALKGEPTQMQWANIKNGKNNDLVLSMILHSKTIFFHNTVDPDSPIDLAFQPKYGNIVSYKWFKDGLIMIGFTSGYFIVISTSMFFVN
jgi:WD repeat-containing protein 19